MNMYMRIIIVFLLSISVAFGNNAGTDANIFGDVKVGGEHMPGVTVYIEGQNKGAITNKSGHYNIVNLPIGEFTIVAKMIGYKVQKKLITTIAGKTLEVNFDLEQEDVSMEEVVVTGMRTPKKITESSVIVNVIKSEFLESVQANSLSEGLNYQPGLRVETDCQTCNYTQLRMNGLGGAYSQVLINSRSIFSPLTSLYGLEQIPAVMVERIEVVRGGGSALYGSSAIGGVVNVITKFPETNFWDIGINNSIISGSVNESHFNAVATVVSEDSKEGLAFFGSHRSREAFDANDDGFSEMPKLKSTSFGANAYFRPEVNHNLELSLNNIYESRRGGDNINSAPHLAEQSEERLHNIIMGSAAYTYYFNNFLSNFQIYSGGQVTGRSHYTGVFPEITNNDSTDYWEHLANPPYGYTDNETYQIGFQLSKNLNNWNIGSLDLLFGSEFVYDHTKDLIEAYDYKIDQTTRNIGTFLQFDWTYFQNLNFLLGLRADKHNFVDELVVSPRFALKYAMTDNTQWRMSYSTGFRAPQAFDTDMHIAFSGGGIQKIVFAEKLKKEKSQSISGSVNYDNANPHIIYGFTLEGFYTKIEDLFILEELSILEDGNSILEKRNGDGAMVVGGSIETRLNYDQLLQFDLGLTIQSSKHEKAIEWSNQIPGTKEFLRSPDSYAYLVFTWTPRLPFAATIAGNYTGSMKVPHYGAPNDLGNPQADVLKTSDPFFDLSFKFTYKTGLKVLESNLEFYVGLQNILDSYQNDFDKGKSRDSNYIYGPSKPRTVSFGIRLHNDKNAMFY